MKRYSKALVVVLGAIVMGITAAVTDDHFSTVEQLQVAAEAFGALTVWLTANYVSTIWYDRMAKFLSAAATAGLVAAIGFLSDDSISTAEWWQILLAVLTAVGVYQVWDEQSRRQVNIHN